MLTDVLTEFAALRVAARNAVCSEPPMPPRGGILADEMGLGKTVTATALLLSEHLGRTLIVCPLSVLSVWKSHLQSFAPSLSVNTFHGKETQGRS